MVISTIEPPIVIMVSINSTSEEVRSGRLRAKKRRHLWVSINSTSEEVRSLNPQTGIGEQTMFPLIQLPRKSEDLALSRQILGKDQSFH